MNSALSILQPYPFQKLRQLTADITPNADYSAINLGIGEPQQPCPPFILQALAQDLSTLRSYPLTIGRLELREAIADWLSNRFSLTATVLDPQQHILPVNGTREALFSFAQATVNRADNPVVVMPNPFYQIYEGAALLAGAEPYFVNCRGEEQRADFNQVPQQIWRRCQLLYICNPHNPTGAVMSINELQGLIQLAHQYDFIIAADECYSELYPDEQQPPAGLLQAAKQMGNDNFNRCLVFHSLSKRSNLPGLRSGFVAGDAAIIKSFLHYRTYHGCALPPPIQTASICAWRDEHHVVENRETYRRRFQAVLPVLQKVMHVTQPDAGFYLWPQTQQSDTEFAKGLIRDYNVTLLPGSYLSRESQGINPGAHRVRLALVASLEQCIDAAQRIADYIEHSGEVSNE